MKAKNMTRMIALLIMVVVAFSVMPASAGTVSARLIAGGGNPESAELIGYVTVSQCGDNLYVTYSITCITCWHLTETHLAVATDRDDIPQRNGNPVPGQFDYAMTHDLPTKSYTYVIPLGEWDAGTELVIAAHAVVVCDCQEETAWAAFIDCGTWLYDFPGRNWALYFTYTVQ